MIQPAKLELRASRNGDLRQRFRFSADGVPLSLVGWSARMQVRKVEGAPGAPYVDVNSTTPTANGSKIDLSDAAVGWIEVIITHQDWSKVPSTPGMAQTLYFDILLSNPDGAVEPYLIGTITFREGVTI